MDNIIDYDLLKLKVLLEQLDEYTRPAQEFFGIRDEDIRKISDRISLFPENVYNVEHLENIISIDTYMELMIAGVDSVVKLLNLSDSQIQDIAWYDEVIKQEIYGLIETLKGVRS